MYGKQDGKQNSVDVGNTRDTGAKQVKINIGKTLLYKPLMESKVSEQVSQEDGTTSRQGGTASGQGGSKSTTVVQPDPYQFADPCPKSMRHVRIGDLSSVDINWKMLTLARPTSKIDEDIFSKYS